MNNTTISSLGERYFIHARLIYWHHFQDFNVSGVSGCTKLRIFIVYIEFLSPVAIAFRAGLIFGRVLETILIQ
jgi:hypothetical protein